MGQVIQIRTPQGTAEIDTVEKTHRLMLPDGGMIIRPFKEPGAPARERGEGSEDHDENLADRLTEAELSAIAEDLLPAIESDWQTSADRRQDIQKALKLLAIRVEEPKSATVEGQSTLRSPLLLEAVLDFQASASAELLPASGPVKMRYDGEGATAETFKLTSDLERDFNHYLTTIASEYYPDTKRMLFDDTGLAGAGFKKVYRCPLRKRPVSESVPGDDLIVNAGATDLANAQRITHRIRMSQAVLKRMQLAGGYRKVHLSPPMESPSELDRDKARTQGLGAAPTFPSTHRFTLYESYCDYDLPGYEHEENGEPTGMPLPYRITIETMTRKVLEIRRDWKPDDPDFKRRKTFVKYPFVEALGFYGIGLMHILGNTTEAMSAAWRVLFDAGMFNNFPGWLYAKDMIKGQDTNNFRVAPGQGVGVNTSGKPIGDVVMNLPYKEPNQAFIALAKLITDMAQRVSGSAQAVVAEGKQDAPVGTTIALLEQATKMMAAVHKGLHAAQAEEFQLLKDLFREDPDAFWRHNKKPSRSWSREQFIAALDDADIVPAADPNTPSHMHRVMRAVGLVQLATAFPELIDPREAIRIALETLGFDTEALLLPPPDPNAQAPAPPPDPVGLAAVEAKKQGDVLKFKTDSENRTSRERIAAAQLQQKERADQRKAAADAMKERAKLAVQARANAMKSMGLGQRVI